MANLKDDQKVTIKASGKNKQREKAPLSNPQWEKSSGGENFELSVDESDPGKATVTANDLGELHEPVAGQVKVTAKNEETGETIEATLDILISNPTANSIELEVGAPEQK